MDDQKKELLTQLSAIPSSYRMPNHDVLIEVLETKLFALLGQVDFENHQNNDELDYFITRIVIQLLIHDSIDIRQFAHQLQQEHGSFKNPLDFDSACRIVHDWCETGGKAAAEIGYPLN
jgi:hypothetical protein